MSPAAKWLLRRGTRVYNSIAFWPTLLAVCFVGLALGMRAFGNVDLLTSLAEEAPFLFVRDRTVSLTLLTTLIGGVISLMVFSFSMVMVLLSNATANLTPRLLPSLVGNDRHQFVLGFYLGTLLYCIIITMGFGVDVDRNVPPSLAVALGVGFGFTCLGLFIYFIHGVSRSIQVGYVLAGVHERTVDGLERACEQQREGGHEDGRDAFPDVTAWHPIVAWRSGFVQGVSAESLTAFAKTHHTALALDIEPGSFVVEGEVLLYARAPLSQASSVVRELRRGFFFGNMTEADDYYAAGVERTIEVALKALSPGINDPGTAGIAIDYLREVFALACALHPVRVVRDDRGDARLFHRTPTWTTILARHLRALREYGADDPQTQQALLRLRESILYRLRKVDRARTTEVQELFAEYGVG